MMRRTLQTVFLTLLIACLAHGFATSTARTAVPGRSGGAVFQPQNPTAVAAIEAYSKQMDAYAKRNARAGRLFGDTRKYEQADEPALWKEFASKRVVQRGEA